jgi:hypothetical protein
MTVKFNGIEIKGTHGLASEGPVELFARRTHFYGLQGMSEIIGGRGGRPLSVDIWMHDEYTNLSDLKTVLVALDKRIGEYGTLEIIDTPETDDNTDYQQVTFLGLERLPLGNRNDTGPLKDTAETVDGGWFQNGRLHFMQLTVDLD